jgi:MerR family redox-sensitive transcriptional activator SoxR
MKISEVAKQTGVLPTTIRYYESVGVLPPTHRVNGHRIYGSDVLDRLAVIRFGLKTGFSLAQLKLLFLGFGSRTKRRTAAQGKLQELKSLRERVKLTEKLLKEMRLCTCGTIQQIAERLLKSGVLDDSTPGLKRLVVSPADGKHTAVYPSGPVRRTARKQAAASGIRSGDNGR